MYQKSHIQLDTIYSSLYTIYLEINIKQGKGLDFYESLCFTYLKSGIVPLGISKAGIFLEPQSYIYENCEAHGPLLGLDRNGVSSI